MNKHKSRLFYQANAPSARRWGSDTILIYDSFLERSSYGPWIRKFKNRYKVKSGESLKAVEGLAKHLQNISDLCAKLESRELTIVVLGGGSVGDFGGFVASVYKRGVRLVMIPSTWLAAIDSAHGGKTALNVGGVKNQIGSFYPATEIYLLKDLLSSQPPIRAIEAMGEVVKMGLISGGGLWKKISQISEVDSADLWRLLPKLITSKYQIVAKDPFEKKGLRHILNLGHSLGHVFEAALGQPHGTAVLNGLAISLSLSHQMNLLSTEKYNEILMTPVAEAFPGVFDLKKMLRQSKNIRKWLGQDKKMIGKGQLRFVFLKKPGQPVVQKIKIDLLLQKLKGLGK